MQGDFKLTGKKFILNADDFGLEQTYNMAVLSGYLSGFLSSASICANGYAFESAINEIVPECPSLGVGVHLNIMEANSLSTEESFRNNYLKLIYLSHDKKFLQETEKEFRLQIEKVMKWIQPTHLDSHVHTHAIPSLFELTCKLAKEYGIKQVRTQYERFYTIPDIKFHLNYKYPPNILKVLLLQNFTKINRDKIKEYGLTTNDYILGVGYTGLMNAETVLYGLQQFEDEDVTVEALIHPARSKGIKQKYKEFMITQNHDLKDKIKRLGFKIGNYKK